MFLVGNEGVFVNYGHCLYRFSLMMYVIILIYHRTSLLQDKRMTQAPNPPKVITLRTGHNKSLIALYPRMTGDLWPSISMRCVRIRVIIPMNKLLIPRRHHRHVKFKNKLITIKSWNNKEGSRPHPPSQEDLLRHRMMIPHIVSILHRQLKHRNRFGIVYLLTLTVKSLHSTIRVNEDHQVKDEPRR